MFDTKIAIVIREDLATWQKLNVTAFLTSGLVGATENILGELYEDALGNQYNALVIQPMIILAATEADLRRIYSRALERKAKLSLYIEEMFSTGNDNENRQAVKAQLPAQMNIVGLALRDDKKAVDKITKGAKMHP